MTNNSHIRVICPNFKRRLSGVTSTIVRLIPLMASKGVISTGYGLPPTIPHISLFSATFIKRDRWRIWHARRNIEMLYGIFLKYILRRRYYLVFTSASQRVHTGYSKWLIRRMDHIISTSRKTADYLDHSSTVIMHGIDTHQFSPIPDKQKLRDQLNLPSGILIGCYGRIRSQKGTDVFVDSMIQVCESHPNVFGIVMGRSIGKDKDFEINLKQKVKLQGLESRILFLPEVPVDRMHHWYQILDIYVAPQRWEGFGLTPIEAMSCGIPTIATDVGAFPELIIESETGTIIPAGNVDAMSASITTLLSSPSNLNQMSLTARQEMQKHFDLNREITEILKVYDSLLD